jgi:molybdopterin-guanine dinucleotide biosynthesis protein A
MLMAHVYDRVVQVAETVIIVVKDSGQAKLVRRLLTCARVVQDDSTEQGPLVGFLAGLRGLKAQYAFVAACDTPFIEPNVVRLLLERALGNDGAIPISEDGNLEPLCAVNKQQRDIAEETVRSGRSSMLGMLDKSDKIVRVPVEEVRKLDPELLTFRNINTVEDLAWPGARLNRTASIQFGYCVERSIA